MVSMYINCSGSDPGVHDCGYVNALTMFSSEWVGNTFLWFADLHFSRNLDHNYYVFVVDIFSDMVTFPV